MTKTILIGILTALCATAAQSSILLQENFDYANGDIDGQGSAGDGWGGAWSYSI